MASPSHRVAVVAGHVTSQEVPRFTVLDNSTGKSYEVEAPDGKFTMDVSQVTPVPSMMSIKPYIPAKPYVPTARNHISSYRARFIGAPFAEGQNLRGCELAPMAVREAGLKSMVERLGWEFDDCGDLQLPSSLMSATSGLNPVWQDNMKRKYKDWVRSGTTERYSKWSGETIRSEESVLVHAAPTGDPYDCVENAKVIGAACGLVYDAVLEAALKGDFALTVGGDHSIASATIGALVKAYPNLAVIWVDAHADANTPDTSPSLHYHGMPAAHVMGWFKKPLAGFEWLKSQLPESRLAYIGLRDVDPDEGRMLQESGAHIFTMQDVDRHGIAQCVSMALSKIDPYNNRPIHMTLDIDGIDPIAAPGTGTLARGGLTYREAHYICEEMAATNRLVGTDIVEVNPLVDMLPEKMHGDDPDMGPASITVQLCVELALSVLGKNIIHRHSIR
jgi:arginase